MATGNEGGAAADPFAGFTGGVYEDGAPVAAAGQEARENDFHEAEVDEHGAVPGDEPAAEPAPKPKTKSAQERIDQAVRRQREAERRAIEADTRYRTLEERLARIERGNAPLTTTQEQSNSYDPTAPNPNDRTKYPYGELDTRYVADLARHEARKELEARDERTKSETRAAKQAEEQRRIVGFLQDGSKKFEDFNETVLETAQRGEWPLSQTIGDLALESPVGHEILYALATDGEEAKRVAALSPSRQAAWFGAMEASLSAGSSAAPERAPALVRTPPVRTTRAPPPPSRRVLGNGGAHPQTVTPDTQDFAAFEALARQANKRA